MIFAEQDRDEYSKLNIKIGEILKIFHDSKNQAISDFPDWKEDKDIRITVFSKILNVLKGVQVGFICSFHCLIHHDFWYTAVNNLKEAPNKEKEIKMLNESFDKVIKLGFLNGLVSCVESFLKTIISDINKKLAPDNFREMYINLLTDLDLLEFKNTLDLLRLCRNTIHTNGIYLPGGKMGNQSIKFKNVTYDFKVREKLDFVTWEFLFEITSSLQEMLYKIMKSAKWCGV